MKVGDLVMMKRGSPMPGLVLEIGSHNKYGYPRYVRVLWVDENRGIEKERDLEVISASG
tara:strand:- start:348 stop:524 length:177 start_codon:yes stop_codon:yes gene_type:complete